MRRLASIAIVVAAIAIASLWVISAPHPAVAENDPFFQQRGDAARGKIVFDAGGCASCHATPTNPPEDEDRTKLGGGLALPTAFGVFHVPNISSDKQDGLGDWSDVDIANALLSGVDRNGRHLYPAFPYTTYAHMTRADARDLIAYLRSLPAVPGRQPGQQLRFPFSIRRGIGVWKALYFTRTPIGVDRARTPSWNRGQYLVAALAHCAECHSPRNAFGAIVSSQRFAGGPDPTGEGWTPNITPGPDGIGKWSTADIVEVLTDGVTPDYDQVGSSMAEVVSNTAALPKPDIQAIADYIKALPPRAGPPRPNKNDSGQRELKSKK